MATNKAAVKTSRAGRKKEGRIRQCIFILPKKLALIEKAIDDNNPDANSLGKVIEGKFA